MALFKCKMCGGELEVHSDASIATCEYCGTKQTVPKGIDEGLQNLYNRANTLRIKCEFDKAERLYEKVIQSNPTQSEAYWGLILCRYGIEYVDDPVTFKKIPTCHRASYDSIIADDDYKSALEHADLSQRVLYEEQAAEINRIQKDILALAQKEETYDVFICYKETDSDGKRTQDSVVANDIYYQLTQEGYKVFYAAITLEGKLGSAYEPIIFAALHSAKVMLSIGTRPEYFNAVWVKNEWSRFLKIMKADRSRLLIPCYRDMDAYELPEEFAHLQAQDMSKIGFINDLVRGIKKVVTKGEPKTTIEVKETVVENTSVSIAPLLKRAFMFLEDGEWGRADEFCEQILNQDPEYAQAYLGKLMAELRVRRQEDLANCAEPFDNKNNYQKVVRFADESLRAELAGYIEQVNSRKEHARLEAIYDQAVRAMTVANTEPSCEKAIRLFKSISGWRDADDQIVACQKKIEEIKAKEEAERLEKERQAEIARKEAERIEKRNMKIAIITTPIVCGIIAFFILLSTVIIPNSKYNEAIALMDAGKYTEAISAFDALDGYKDSGSKIIECYGGIRLSKNKEQLKAARVGDYIKFGLYEQDNDTSNGKEEIEWLVLEVKDGKALVISKYALDCKPYNTSNGNTTWETCTPRKWLNNGFINEAFSADEKAMIPTVTVSADKNPSYSTDPGNATQDQVFLLGITEVNKYFSSDSARKCKPTKYAVANGVSVSRSGGNCMWWLRSPGLDQGGAAGVDDDGDVVKNGYFVNYGYIAVRPAMWIDLNA